jgi:hypothetical protein
VRALAAANTHAVHDVVPPTVAHQGSNRNEVFTDSTTKASRNRQARSHQCGLSGETWRREGAKLIIINSIPARKGSTVVGDGFGGVSMNKGVGEELLDNSNVGEGAWQRCSPEEAAHWLHGSDAGWRWWMRHDELGSASFASSRGSLHACSR